MNDNKQLEATQENAKLGGVKTPEGKSVSKFNAITHGILRNSITEYEQEFYSKISEDLEAEYQPQGVTEQILIERIVICYLKLFRLQKAETEFMKSKLNPHIVSNPNDELVKSLLGKEVIINEGYTPRLSVENIEQLANIYSRYETTIENRLFRAIHELERAQKVRRGENILQPVAIDINQVGSFGETGQNL